MLERAENGYVSHSAEINWRHSWEHRGNESDEIVVGTDFFNYPNLEMYRYAKNHKCRTSRSKAMIGLDKMILWFPVFNGIPGSQLWF